MLRSVLMMVLLLGSATANADGLYRWVDANGKVHYTDSPPPDSARKSEKRAHAAPPAAVAGLSYANQVAAKNFPVSLYTAAKCGEPCDQARNLLNKRGVPFTEISIADGKLHDELVRLAGSAELPALRVGKQFTKGFETGLFNAALDIAGYGRSPAPGQAKSPLPVPATATPASNTQAESEPEPKPKGRYAD